MSSQFFPTLHTSSWKMTRSPQWNTGVQTAVTGDRKRNPLQGFPRWKWALKNGVLQSAYGDLQAIQNLYNAMYGRLDWFLWLDPEGDTIIDPTVQINLSGTYYWPVAFTADALDFDRFAYQLWECGTLSFEQVLLPTAIFATIQEPHGAITSAILSVLSSHTKGGGPGAIIGNNGVGLFDRGWLQDSTDWTLRTNTTPVAVTSLGTGSITGLTVIFTFNTQSPGPCIPSETFLIYDCSVFVTFFDGTTQTFRPQSFSTFDADDPTGVQGTVTNPGNAIDGNPATAATLTKTSATTIDFSPLLAVYNFA